MYFYICVNVHIYFFYMCIDIFYIYILKNHLIIELVTAGHFKQSSFLSLTSFSCLSPHPVPFFILFNFLSCDDFEWITLPGIKNVSWQYFQKLILHWLMQMKLTSALSFLSKRNVCLHTSSFLEEGGGGENPFHKWLYIEIHSHLPWRGTTDVCTVTEYQDW